jgi:alpha 1,3-glucosidase
MPKDNVHYGGWEHRDVHNINGMLYVNFPMLKSLFSVSSLTVMFSKSDTTYNGILERSNPPKRPFVLTRSFFAGSQRAGAMWTGDSDSTWEHMTVGIKMVLANGIAGMTFAGCKPFLSIHELL